MIGIFDSGVGGLSLYQGIREKLPDVPLTYVADSGFAPYGIKTDEQIVNRAIRISRFLRNRGASIIVVACNTATTIAMETLRETFSDVLFVGCDAPLKMALDYNPKNRIAVIGTEAMVRSEKLKAQIRRISEPYGDVSVALQPATDFVALVERENLYTIEAELAVRDFFRSLLDDFHMNSLVLGATHFSFLAPIIQKVIGSYIPIFDSRESVANQTKRVYDALTLASRQEHRHGDSFFTTGNRASLKHFLESTLAIETDVYEV